MTNAREAAAAAFEEIREAIADGQSFAVEAGAGAGKTYSLVETLQHLIERSREEAWPRHRRIACITYTNVAKNEIVQRIDSNPIVFCDTIHAFSWQAIQQFPAQIRSDPPRNGKWAKRIEEHPIVDQRVTYGQRPWVSDTELSLGHNDVIELFARLLERAKFRRMLADMFPYILIDEYQDSERALMAALAQHFGDQGSGLVLGLFGDPWQQIFPGTCGALADTSLRPIAKMSNFRSTHAVIDVLNKMRPELPQEPDTEAEQGAAAVYHTNEWTTPRRADRRWVGDLEPADLQRALMSVKRELGGDGPADPKILMLTHQALGDQQGYGDLVRAFSDNERLDALDDPLLALLVNTVEPVSEAYADRRYGAMFEQLGERRPWLTGAGDKQRWIDGMKAIIAERDAGTAGSMLKTLRATELLPIPEAVDRIEDALEKARATGDKPSSRASDFAKLLDVRYGQIVAFRPFHLRTSVFATKHGVKGAEFDDVLVVLGRGWDNYNFNSFLEMVAAGGPEPDEVAKYQRNRNLFYVACSRPKTRLTLLFSQEVSGAALGTLEEWFGPSHVHSLPDSR
jgi:DNA helicase-2/ATP-dependent DNA helicase PcrA